MLPDTILFHVCHNNQVTDNVDHIFLYRHGLHNRKKPVENISNVTNKPPPSFHQLSVALSETGDEVKEPMGQRSMANSLVGGNINSRKTRSLLFVKTEQKPDQAYQGKYQCMVSHFDVQVTRKLPSYVFSFICCDAWISPNLGNSFPSKCVL